MPPIIGGLIVGGLELASVGGIAGFSLASTTIFGVGIIEAVGTVAILGASVGLQYALQPDLDR